MAEPTEPLIDDELLLGGLTWQQEIRARAVDNATDLVCQALRLGMVVMTEPGNVAAGVGDLTTQVAREIATWIEHGDDQKPESGHVS